MAVRHLLLGSGPAAIALRLLVGLVVLALALTAYAVWLRPSDFSRSVALLPADSARVLWTDWQGVRDELGCRDCADELAGSDLGSASVVASSGDALEKSFRWGPRSIGWELVGQGTKGQVVIAGGLTSDAVESIAEAYEERGFTAPARRLEGGVWSGSADLLSPLGINEGIFVHVAFLAEHGLLLTSDDPAWLAKAVTAARAGDSLDLDLTGAVDRPLAAVALTHDRACAELGFATADARTRTEATDLVEQAGGVTPLDGYLVALGAGRAWTAVLGFESGRQAERDLLPRQRLAAGEDPGQMEDYADVFTVEEATTEGSTVVLRGHARPSAYALTETTQGPVLLASC